MKIWRTVFAATFLAGCTPVVGPSSVVSPPSSSARPSPTCSRYNSSPKPCTPQEQAETEKLNSLIAQSEQTYRTYFAEDERIQRAGGVTKATPVLQRTLAGQALKSVMEIYKDLKANKTRAAGGSFTIVSITAKPTRTRDGSDMSLAVCWKAKGVKFSVDGQTLTRNATVREDSYLRQVDGMLKIFIFESKEVSKC